MYTNGPPLWSEFWIFIEKPIINSEDIFIDSTISVFRETKYGICCDIKRKNVYPLAGEVRIWQLSFGLSR